MLADYFTWDTPWELYFHILIFIPIIQRLIFLGEPALKAIQIHGHHLRWLFDRLLEIPKGYSIAAKFIIWVSLLSIKPSFDLFIDDRAINNKEWYKKNNLEIRD